MNNFSVRRKEVKEKIQRTKRTQETQRILEQTFVLLVFCIFLILWIFCILSSMLKLPAHGIIALIAFIPLFVWGGLRAASLSEKAADSLVEIGIEHTKPVSVAMSHSRGGSVHLLDLTNQGQQSIQASVPEGWIRGEVRNMQLQDLVVEPPEFGFKRYTIPAGGTVGFSMEKDIRQLTVHNASKEPLSFHVTTIHVRKKTSETESFLMKEEPLRIRFER